MDNISTCAKALLTAIEKGYTVDNLGDVYSKHKKLKKIQQKAGGITYHSFSVRLNGGKSKLVNIHRYVAYKKYGEKIFEKGIEVRHLDSNPLNNLWENIGIGTAKDNAGDKSPETSMKAALTATSFVKIHNHEEIIKLHNEGMSYKRLMEKFNISSKGTISFIINKSINNSKTD